MEKCAHFRSKISDLSALTLMKYQTVIAVASYQHFSEGPFKIMKDLVQIAFAEKPASPVTVNGIKSCKLG